MQKSMFIAQNSYAIAIILPTAEYPESSPYKKCAEMSSEQAHTHEPFITAHVSSTIYLCDKMKVTFSLQFFHMKNENLDFVT